MDGRKQFGSGPRARLIRAGLALLISTALWLPMLHLFLRPKETTVAALRTAVRPRLLASQLDLWASDSERQREQERMRRSNAEWDFMARSYLAWSLANVAFDEPALREKCLSIMDTIIDETLRLEQQHGMHHFLMRYAGARPFRMQPARSLFVDSEIALMLAMRRLVREHSPYRAEMTARIDSMYGRMRRSPILCAESYPDECWMFDNANALVAMRLADRLDGTEHSVFMREWVACAQRRLVDPSTGMLVSSFTLDGVTKDGPEGSSIWMVAHSLLLVDADFARQQYERAARTLSCNVLGFGYSREWPAGLDGVEDVDSGPIVPMLNASPGASGLALVGASAFDDAPALRRFMTSLNLAAFPADHDGRLKYLAGNSVGDAVILYASSLGPIWKAVGPPPGGGK